jgi:hypothetical protein
VSVRLQCHAGRSPIPRPPGRTLREACAALTQLDMRTTTMTSSSSVQVKCGGAGTTHPTPSSTAQLRHSTAQHSTGQHGTAWHGTERHSTAQNSTAQQDTWTPSSHRATTWRWLRQAVPTALEAGAPTCDILVDGTQQRGGEEAQGAVQLLGSCHLGQVAVGHHCGPHVRQLALVPVPACHGQGWSS